MAWVGRVWEFIYWHGRGALYRVPGLVPLASWFGSWTDPLCISRRLLRRALRERALLARGWLLDIGSGKQPYRDAFSRVEHYIGLDLASNRWVDVRGDGVALPFRDAVFDTVLCNQVLEHVAQPAQLLREAARTLKPGGVLLLTTPQTWGLHLEPHDYYRYTKYGLRYLAESSALSVLEVTPTCGLWATMTQRIADTIVNTYVAGRSRWLRRFVSLALAPVMMAGYGLDRLFGKRGDALDHVMVARKSDSGIDRKYE